MYIYGSMFMLSESHTKQAASSIYTKNYNNIYLIGHSQVKNILFHTVDDQTNCIAGVIKELCIFGKDITKICIEELNTIMWITLHFCISW